MSAQITQKNKAPKMEHYSITHHGHNYWLASWYAEILGYKSLRTFMPTIKRAMLASSQLGIPPGENFLKISSGRKVDYHLTKFACFMLALNADDKKLAVRKARAYFLNELEEADMLVANEDYMNRNLAREEIRKLNKDLISAARSAKVKDFRKFANKGYMGLYNRTAADLRESKGIPDGKDLADYMGPTELAANIFRLALTGERLKHIQANNEKRADFEHWKIGRQIRKLIKDNLDQYPESLPVHQSLKKLESNLVSAQKYLNQQLIDTE